MEAVTLLQMSPYQTPPNPDCLQHAEVHPSSHSLSGALGVALLEALVRISDQSGLTTPIWNKLQTFLDHAISYCQESQSLQMLQLFGTTMQLFRNNQYSVKDRLSWINQVCTQNTDGRMTSLSYFMKVLVSQDLQPSYLPYDPATLNHFCTEYQVHLLIYTANPIDSFCSTTQGPLLLLGYDGSFSVLYHNSHLAQLHEAHTALTTGYPFVYQSSVAVQPPSLGFGTASPPTPPAKGNPHPHPDMDVLIKNRLTEVLKCFCSYCMNPSQSKSDLIKAIQSAKDVYPMILSNEMKQLMELLEKCHPDSEEFTPRCGKPHCIQCLFKNVESSNPKCPCGTLLTLKEIDNIKEKQRPNPVVSGLPPPPLPVSNFVMTGSMGLNKDQRELVPGNPKLGELRGSLNIQTNLELACLVCNGKKERESFELVKCREHNICSECRVREYVELPDLCKICKRAYSPGEIDTIQIAGAQLGIEVPLPVRNTFQCGVCNTRKPNEEKGKCPNSCPVCVECLAQNNNMCPKCDMQVGEKFKCGVCRQEINEDIWVLGCHHPSHRECNDQACNKCLNN